MHIIIIVFIAGNFQWFIFGSIKTFSKIINYVAIHVFYLLKISCHTVNGIQHVTSLDWLDDVELASDLTCSGGYCGAL